MPKSKNLASKTRPQDKPYEIWTAPGFEWRVLKKYKSEEAEAKDPYARWFCATKGPGTFGSYELGDGYARDIKAHATRTYRDPVLDVKEEVPSV